MEIVVPFQAGASGDGPGALVIGGYGTNWKRTMTMLTPWHDLTFEALYDHPLSKIARANVPGKDLFVYRCKVTGYFGIGYFLKSPGGADENPHNIWPDAKRGTRVFKELVSLGQDLQAVGPEKIVELRQRLRFNVKEAQALIKTTESCRLEALQAQEDENQSVRDWLSQESGYAGGATSLWNRKRIKFSFAGKGGSKATVRHSTPSFGSLGD